MREAIYTLVVGIAVMAVVALLILPRATPRLPLRDEREFMRCAPHSYIDRTLPPDCPPADGPNSTVQPDPSRRPHDPNR